jgi:hypothetical protein
MGKTVARNGNKVCSQRVTGESFNLSCRFWLTLVRNVLRIIDFRPALGLQVHPGPGVIGN